MSGKFDINAFMAQAAAGGKRVHINHINYTAGVTHYNPVGSGATTINYSSAKPYDQCTPSSDCLEALILKYINTPALANQFLTVIYEKFENLNPAVGYSQLTAQRMDGLPIPLAIQVDIKESAKAREAEAMKRRIAYMDSLQGSPEMVQSPTSASTSGGRLRAG